MVPKTKPQITRRDSAQSFLWGDDDSGYANDKFYSLTQELSIVVACIPPGGRFTSSDTFKAIFDADEALYVLEGQYTIQNPENGEIRTANAGDLIYMKGPQWHYGYNFSDQELRVFEAIAPLDLSNAAAVKPMPETTVAWDADRLADFPAMPAAGHHKMSVVRECETVRTILGVENPMRVDVFVSSDRVAFGRFELAAGRRSDPLCWTVDATVFVQSGRLHVRIKKNSFWEELNAEDLVSLPAGTEFEIFNHGGERAAGLLAIGGNFVTKMGCEQVEE